MGHGEHGGWAATSWWRSGPGARPAEELGQFRFHPRPSLFHLLIFLMSFHTYYHFTYKCHLMSVNPTPKALNLETEPCNYSGRLWTKAEAATKRRSLPF